MGHCDVELNEFGLLFCGLLLSVDCHGTDCHRIGQSLSA